MLLFGDLASLSPAFLFPGLRTRTIVPKRRLKLKVRVDERPEGRDEAWHGVARGLQGVIKVDSDGCSICCLEFHKEARDQDGRDTFEIVR